MMNQKDKEVGKQIEELTPGKPIYATIVQDDGGGQQVIKDSIAKAKEFLAAAGEHQAEYGEHHCE